MKFIYNLNPLMPHLAWIASCQGDNIEITYGDEVETTDAFFVEGAWDGSFSEGDFLSSEWFCGTGGKIINDHEVAFSTPSHVTSGLFYYVNDAGFDSGVGGILISNSMYLLLAKIHCRLDPCYMYYERDFATIMEGINGYEEKIRIWDCENNAIKYLKRVFYRDLIVDNNGNISLSLKGQHEPFQDYNEYRDCLNLSMKGLVVNASYEGRKKRYGVVTTISRGYDAPCCSVIAQEVGCDTALTYAANGKYKDDSGADIARELGYSKIIEEDANSYMLNTGLEETFYLCTGEMGASISTSVFDEYFEGNLVFTGDRGDCVWDKNCSYRNNEFHFADDMLSHLGISERRLWVGYIQVPMPLYGASAWESMYNIANNNEMKDWCLNNGYDRPIPRRIVEEKGIKRDDFGIKKHGAGFSYHFDWMNRLLGRMSEKSAKSFKEYVKGNKKRDIHFMPELMEYLKVSWPAYYNELAEVLGLKKAELNKGMAYKAANPFATRYLIPWAGEIITRKYENIFNSSSKQCQIADREKEIKHI